MYIQDIYIFCVYIYIMISYIHYIIYSYTYITYHVCFFLILIYHYVYIAYIIYIYIYIIECMFIDIYKGIVFLKPPPFSVLKCLVPSEGCLPMRCAAAKSLLQRPIVQRKDGSVFTWSRRAQVFSEVALWC